MQKLPIRIAFNTLVQALGKLISASTTFLIIVMVGRALGEAGYGQFAKIFALVELFYMVVDFGFNAVVVRAVSLKRPKISSYFGNLLGMRMIWSIFWVIAVSALSWALPYDEATGQGFTPLLKVGVLIASLSLLTQAIFLSTNSIFQLRLRYDQSVLASSIGSLAKLLLVFLVTRSTISLLSMVTAIVGGELIMAGVALYLARLQVRFYKPHFNLGLWRQIFIKSLPIGLALVFNLIYFRSDTLILAFFRGPAEVGIYSLGYRFFEAALVVPIFFANALYPVLLADFQRGLSRLRKTVITASLFMLGSSLAVSLLIFILGPIMVRLFFAGAFLESIKALRVLILGLPFFYTSAILMWLLVVLEKQRLLAVIYAAAALLTVGLNLLFIPLFGYLAAALITVFSEGLVLLAILSATFFFLKEKRLQKAGNPV